MSQAGISANQPASGKANGALPKVSKTPQRRAKSQRHRSMAGMEGDNTSRKIAEMAFPVKWFRLDHTGKTGRSEFPLSLLLPKVLALTLSRLLVFIVELIFP
jgi:hypothetical protein